MKIILTALITLLYCFDVLANPIPEICFRSEILPENNFKIWEFESGLAECYGEYFGECFQGGGALYVRGYLGKNKKMKIVVFAITVGNLGDFPKLTEMKDLSVTRNNDGVWLGKLKLLKAFSERDNKWVPGIVFNGTFFE